MVLPVNLGQRPPETLVREALFRAELLQLTKDRATFDSWRDYYDGNQPLAFTTALFRRTFGDAFAGFRDNWMQVIVDAIEDRLTFEGYDIEDTALNGRIWETFLNNEFDAEQLVLFNGVLVEDRAFVIVWPDDELGAKIDWQPAQLCRVRYDPDNRRRALWALKRWQDDNGDTLVNIYTDSYVYKYMEQEGSDINAAPSSPSAKSEIPLSANIGTLTPREVPGESWPLPHPFGMVPVVEINNTKFTSELDGHTTQQDALNKTLLDMLITGEFQSFRQRYVETLADEPVGGWRASPGEIWQFRPGFDAEGRVVPGQFGSFEVTDPSVFIKPVEMWLDHIAMTSRTPARLFRQIDRGGRGDAQSGDAMLVDDKPLNDKIEKKQKAWRGPLVQLGRLVARALDISGDPIPLSTGVLWTDPRYENRVAVLNEAIQMVNIGLPFKYVIRNLNLTPTEIEEIEQWKDEEKAEQQAEQEAQMKMQAEMSSRGSESRPSNSDGGSSGG